MAYGANNIIADKIKTEILLMQIEKLIFSFQSIKDIENIHKQLYFNVFILIIPIPELIDAQTDKFLCKYRKKYNLPKDVTFYETWHFNHLKLLLNLDNICNIKNNKKIINFHQDLLKIV